MRDPRYEVDRDEEPYGVVAKEYFQPPPRFTPPREAKKRLREIREQLKNK